MKIPFLDLPAQYQSIKNEVDAAIATVVDKCAFVGGKELKNFEAEFAAFQSVDHCIGVANGTDAIEIAIEALDLPAGSQIIVPSNTFIATAEAVVRLGHKVVFCDYVATDMTMDIGDVETRITDRTAAIIAVHLYGHPCNMGPLMSLAAKYKLAVIEDSAQAHGAEYDGRRVGGIGHVGTFSFFPGKNLGAFGDGGAITTNNKRLAETCRRLANHGRLLKFDHDIIGRNSRLDNLQASILSVKLGHLENWTNHRIDIANRYISGLADCISVTLPQRASWARQVYHLFVIRCDARDELRKFLVDRGVATGIHYPLALSKMPVFSDVGQVGEPMLANQEDSRLLSLPIGDHINAESCDYVCRNIKEFYANK